MSGRSEPHPGRAGGMSRRGRRHVRRQRRHVHRQRPCRPAAVMSAGVASEPSVAPVASPASAVRASAASPASAERVAAVATIPAGARAAIGDLQVGRSGDVQSAPDQAGASMPKLIRRHHQSGSQRETRIRGAHDRELDGCCGRHLPVQAENQQDGRFLTRRDDRRERGTVNARQPANPATAAITEAPVSAHRGRTPAHHARLRPRPGSTRGVFGAAPLTPAPPSRRVPVCG